MRVAGNRWLEWLGVERAKLLARQTRPSFSTRCAPLLGAAKTLALRVSEENGSPKCRLADDAALRHERVETEGVTLKRMGMRQDMYLVKQLTLGVMILFAVPGVRAQNDLPLTELRQSSAEVLKAFEPALDQEYQLGRGDEITVTVNANPELSGKHIIGPDGRITLPLAGDVELDGKSRTEAAAAIRSALSTYYQNISVFVSVDHYTSNHILLLGAVERPGLLTFDGPPTLLEVIARGGVGMHASMPGSDTASASAALPAPLAVPQLCMIYRGNQTLVTVRLRDLVKTGDPNANLRLRRDDIVFVPGESSYVSVLGSVLHPGIERLESTSTLTQLLAQSGGPTDKGGRYAKIFIVHAAIGSVAGSVSVVSFEDIVAGKPIYQLLHSGDVIYVPENGFNRAADVLQKISPLISLITVGALLR